jgi:hypothetical protein
VRERKTNYNIPTDFQLNAFSTDLVKSKVVYVDNFGMAGYIELATHYFTIFFQKLN